MVQKGTFIVVDDHIDEHPKIVGLSDAAFRLLIDSWCYSSRNRTDGRLTDAAWRKRGTPKTRRELLDGGLAAQCDGYVQMHDYLDWQRSAAEIAELKQKRSESGRKGGQARARGQASAKQVPEQTDSEAQPETETETETSLRSVGRARRGTRLPDDFAVSDEMRSWTGDQGWADRWVDATTERFVDYWRGQPGQRGVKLDWPATWRNWLRREAERGQPVAAAAASSSRQIPSWEL